MGWGRPRRAPGARAPTVSVRTAPGAPASIVVSSTVAKGISSIGMAPSSVMSGHLRLLPGLGGHLEEELLEIARGPREGRDPDPGRDRRGEELRGCLVVTAEPKLDLAVVEDR